VARHCAFEDLDEATRHWELAFNVDGVVNCTLAVAPDMLSRGSGSVEWGPKGVRVNTIAHGWIVPHRNDEIAAGSFWNRLEFVGTPEEGMHAALEAGTLPNMSHLPIKRLGRPEDIANLAMFLASDVSGYITGQLISVSGGVYMP